MEIKIAETITRGSPLASKENTVCLYGPSGSGKTTAVIDYLVKSGKSCVYLDFDGNSAPIAAAPPEVLDKMNYIKIRNSRDVGHVGRFIDASMTDPIIKVCLEHGYLGCGTCARKQGDVLQVNFDDWAKYDLVIVDSASVMVESLILFSIKLAKAENEFNAMNVWSRVNLSATTMLHFLRECHRNVIVISHPLDISLGHEKAIQKRGHPRFGRTLVEPYFKPCFGSVPFTREKAVKKLSAVIYQAEDGTIETNSKIPFFANTRREIKSTTASGALLEILG